MTSPLSKIDSLTARGFRRRDCVGHAAVCQICGGSYPPSNVCAAYCGGSPPRYGVTRSRSENGETIHGGLHAKRCADCNRLLPPQMFEFNASKWAAGRCLDCWTSVAVTLRDPHEDPATFETRYVVRNGQVTPGGANNFHDDEADPCGFQIVDDDGCDLPSENPELLIEEIHHFKKSGKLHPRAREDDAT